MKLRILFLGTLALAPLSAYAVRYVGNGGNVVQCETSDGNATYEVLDSFENRFLRKRTLVLENGSPKDIASKAVAELKVLSPERAQRYQKDLERFNSESELTDAKLTPLEDAKYTGIPNHCQVVQAVIQQDFATPESKRYFIQKSVWEKLSSEQKAVLMLHEIVYREALSLGQTDSVATRAFVGLLISGEIKKLPPPEFARTLFNLDFDTFEAQGLALRLFEMRNGTKVSLLPEFGSKGQLLSGDLVDVGELHLANLNPAASVRGKLKPNPAHVEFWEDTTGAPKHIETREDLDLVGVPPSVKSREIWLNQDGILSGVQAEEAFQLSFENHLLNLGPGKLAFNQGILAASYAPILSGWIEANGKPVSVQTDSEKQDLPLLEFLPSGRLASFSARSPIPIPYRGHILPLAHLKFHENAEIAEGQLAESVSISEEHRSYKFEKNDVLYFASNGELIPPQAPEPNKGKVMILPCIVQGGAQIRPGDELKITYLFRGGPTSRKRIMFVHFLDGKEDPVLYFDIWPSTPSDSWSGDYVFSQQISLPAFLKPGKYRIVVGLRDPKVQSDRLSMDVGPKVIELSRDRYQVGEIEVKPPLTQASAR